MLPTLRTDGIVSDDILSGEEEHVSEATDAVLVLFPSKSVVSHTQPEADEYP
jgi:hypothetical protein